MHQTTRYALLALLAASVHATAALAQSSPVTTRGMDPDNGTRAVDEDSIGIQRKDSLSPAQRQARRAELRRSREANGGKLPDEIGGSYSPGNTNGASATWDTHADMPAEHRNQ